MDDYYFSCVVVLSSMLRHKNVGEKCAVVLKLTESIRGGLEDISLAELTKYFDRIQAELIEEAGKKKFDWPIDVTNAVVRFVCAHLRQDFTLEYPCYELTAAPDDPQHGVWQLVDAPWIWQWIHVSTIHVDLTYGVKEKSYFIVLVESMVGCSLCKSNYTRKKQILINGLEKYSLTDLFLQLHTQTKSGVPFVLNRNLIQKKEKEKFLHQYCSLV